MQLRKVKALFDVQGRDPQSGEVVDIKAGAEGHMEMAVAHWMAARNVVQFLSEDEPGSSHKPVKKRRAYKRRDIQSESPQHESDSESTSQD